MADVSELVVRARRGDVAAFEALVRRFYRAAYATALGVLNNPMDAEDACQEAFIRALERIDDCDPERFAGWLIQIVRNRARNRRDYERVRDGPDLEIVSAASSERTDDAVKRSELRARLEAALGALTDAQREVVLLHDLEGWKHREIAESLGISEVMARQQLFVARRDLRERLGRETLKEFINE